MKLNHLFFAAAAAVLAFAACEPQEKIDVPDLQVTPSSISFDAGASSQTVTLTATRDWTVSGAPEWLAFDPAGGKASDASQTVTITAMANSGYNRSTDVTFTIGLMKAYVHVDQTGEKGVKDNGKGTLESPFTVEGVKAYIDGLDNPSAASPDKVYIKGKITRINDKGTYGESGTFSNATFYISDDGTTDNEFYCYRIAYLGNKKFSTGQTDIKVGDEVIVYGNVILYGTSNPVYETSQGTAYLYSLNGETGPGSVPAGDPKGTGAKDDPYNVAAALNAVKDLTWTSTSVYDKVGPFYVKGKISRIADKGTYGESGTYSNATFYISDDGSTDNEFYCYRISYLANKKYAAGQTDIKVGDEVVIYGELMNYRSDTPETVQGSAYLYSLNGDTGSGGDTPGPSGEAKGTGTKDDPFNSVAAANAVKNLTWTSNDTYETTGEVYVKGKISKIASKGTFGESGTYGNASFYISDDGTSKDEFYCYRILYLGNEKYTSGTDIKVGDEVVVCGQLMNYQGKTPETVAGKAHLYSLNGQTAGGGDTPPAGETDHGATTVAAFLAAAESTSDWYELTGVISGLKEGDQFGNFDLTDDSGTVYVYGVLSTKGGDKKKFQELVSQYGIKDGGTITIKANRGSFQGKDEAVNAYFISYKGGGDTPPAGETDHGATAISAFLTAAESTSDWYELTGVISNLKEGDQFGNFDLTDDSGTVYVYGVLSTKGGEKKKFQELVSQYGIKDGGTITIKANRGSFQGKDEAVNAYFISYKGGGDTPPGPSGSGSGTLADPYTPAGAIAAVANLTWTSNTDYQKTDKVYVKGKISKIANNGTYTQGGTYGNASYYISADGTENEEFYIFRSLYFNGEKYTSGTDIKVGDEVIVYGALMNYQGKTPETVANESYLYSLNGATTGGGDSGQGQGGGETGGDVSFNTNATAQTWSSETDDTYGSGFSSTTKDVKVGYYKYKSSSNAVEPKESEVRIYKNSALVVTAPSGKKIKKLVITTPSTENGKYCVDMTGVEGGGNGKAEVSALTVTWTGSASKVVLQADGGQVRMSSIALEFE